MQQEKTYSKREEDIILGLWISPGVGERTLAQMMAEKAVSSVFCDQSERERLLQAVAKRSRSALNEVLNLGEAELLARGRSCRQSLLELGALPLFWKGENFPPQLTGAAKAPPVLSVKGNLAVLSKPQLAVVGTRHPSQAALELGAHLLRRIPMRYQALVSGGAVGIDAMAHRLALSQDIPTVVVAGTGLDEVYPKGHRQLFDEIHQNGGAIVSQFAPASPPRAGRFPRRNWTIAGLAKAIVVVEAPEKSGALHTARAALASHRELWVLAGRAFESQAFGGHSLVKAGRAKLLDRLNDLDTALSDATPPTSRRTTESALFLQSLSLPARKVVQLCHSPIHRDALAEKLDLRGELASILLELELAGLIERLPGERYRSLI